MLDFLRRIFNRDEYCHRCGERFKSGQQCRFCGNYFCSRHAFPYNHDCKQFGKKRKNLQMPGGTREIHHSGGQIDIRGE
jgi:predicted nucleic acid binding AN1-type Zn finger protein